ncbi:hypothetical protein [Embleya sp. NPDC059259]|uniref:hypothetical protein n=1 Tax=unclassified Embleya TaxID=2699296 RepID=UPI0036A5814D
MYEEIHLAASRINPQVGRAADLPEEVKAALYAVAGNPEPSYEHLNVLMMRHRKEFGTTAYAQRLGQALVELRVALTVASSAGGTGYVLVAGTRTPSWTARRRARARSIEASGAPDGSTRATMSSEPINRVPGGT